MVFYFHINSSWKHNIHLIILLLFTLTYSSHSSNCSCCTKDVPIVNNSTWWNHPDSDQYNNYKLSEDEKTICYEPTGEMTTNNNPVVFFQDGSSYFISKGQFKKVILSTNPICYNMKDVVDIEPDVNPNSLSNHIMWLDQSILEDDPRSIKWSFNAEGSSNTLCLDKKFWSINLQVAHAVSKKTLFCNIFGTFVKGGSWRKEMWMNLKFEEDAASLNWVRLRMNKNSKCRYGSVNYYLLETENGRFGELANGKNERLGIKLEFKLFSTRQTNFLRNTQGSYCSIESNLEVRSKLLQLSYIYSGKDDD